MLWRGSLFDTVWWSLIQSLCLWQHWPCIFMCLWPPFLNLKPEPLIIHSCCAFINEVLLVPACACTQIRLSAVQSKGPHCFGTFDDGMIRDYLFTCIVSESTTNESTMNFPQWISHTCCRGTLSWTPGVQSLTISSLLRSMDLRDPSPLCFSGASLLPGALRSQQAAPDHPISNRKGH